MLYLFGGIGLLVLFDIVRSYPKAKNKKNYLTKTLISLALLIFLLFLFGPLFVLSPIKVGYSTLKENQIILYYPKNKIDMARDVMIQLKQADEMNKQFYKNTFPMPVILAMSELDMLRFGAYPYGGGAGSELSVVIRPGIMTTGKIAHEMSHRNLAMKTGKSIPSPNWFNEGLASYIGKMEEYRKPDQLRTDLIEGRYVKDILRMRGILGAAIWIKKIQIDRAGPVLYGQTYLMVKYLFDKYGQDKMYSFVISLKNNDFEKAFVRSFNMTEERFFQEFTDYIQNYQKDSPT